MRPSFFPSLLVFDIMPMARLSCPMSQMECRLIGDHFINAGDASLELKQLEGSLVAERLARSLDGTGTSLEPLLVFCKRLVDLGTPATCSFLGTLVELQGLELVSTLADETEAEEAAGVDGASTTAAQCVQARAKCGAKDLAAALHMRHSGDLNASIAALKQAASFCGSHHGGLFSWDMSGAVAAALPLSSSSLWWLHRYSCIFLEISDAWARAGHPFK